MSASTNKVSQVFEKIKQFTIDNGDLGNTYAIHEAANGNCLGNESFFPDISETPVFCLSGSIGWYCRINNKRHELRAKYPNAFYLETDFDILFLFTREEVDACPELTKLCSEIKRNSWCDIDTFLSTQHPTKDVFMERVNELRLKKQML